MAWAPFHSGRYRGDWPAPGRKIRRRDYVGGHGSSVPGTGVCLGAVVCSQRAGGAPAPDQEVASRLHASGKTILEVANKADHAGYDGDAEPLAALGFDRIFPVSAIHGRGIENLMRAAMSELPESLETNECEEPTPEENAALKLAIVGRPNVGKSSIINAFAQSERVIVSPIAGTTRDSVDVPIEIENEGQRHAYVLIDTAGIRKKRRVADSVEFFSVKRAEDSIERCDIAIHVMDAQCGVTVQDKKIAGKIVEAKKACIWWSTSGIFTKSPSPRPATKFRVR